MNTRKQEYALGGAIALGYWGVPRGTVDVDVTIYLAPDQPSECVWLLQEIGCEFSSASATESLREHGFCRVAFAGTRVDVFLPTVPFYAAARTLRTQSKSCGPRAEISTAHWIREQLVSMYGARDPPCRLGRSHPRCSTHITVIRHMTNPMAQAWLDAATDLGIRVEHPFTFTTKSGILATTLGVFLPDFGGPMGMLLLCRFDSEELYDLADDTDYAQSALNPCSYEPYRARALR